MREILDFWFGQPQDPQFGQPRKVWFKKDPLFDQAVRSHFLEHYHLAAASKLDRWQETPEGCLALILLLDQFPRNMFRGKAQAFATDHKALAIADYAIANQFDRQMLPGQRLFIYIPFEHSENLAHQQRAIDLLNQLKHEPYSASFIDYAVRHFQVIDRFGRFPHRNQILGRETTPEEAEFLKQPGSSF
jgi:uncharacterized protein (DUF924 family)